jgi:hypothetical protein
MRRYWLLAIIAVIILILIVLTVAWVRGGEVPVHEISRSIPIPGVPK